jgi:hypothetical protein
MRGIEDVKDPTDIAIVLCRKLHRDWANLLEKEANLALAQSELERAKSAIMVETHIIEEYLKAQGEDK